MAIDRIHNPTRQSGFRDKGQKLSLEDSESNVHERGWGREGIRKGCFRLWWILFGRPGNCPHQIKIQKSSRKKNK
jgi:hypothetical protein